MATEHETRELAVEKIMEHVENHYHPWQRIFGWHDVKVAEFVRTVIGGVYADAWRAGYAASLEDEEEHGYWAGDVPNNRDEVVSKKTV